MRVEIGTEVQGGHRHPVGAIRDPDAGVPLPLKARAFVRRTTNEVQPPVPRVDGVVRILFVPCRPKGAGDVPFRSVASPYNVAARLAQARRFADAKDYALAALRGFQTFGADTGRWFKRRST